MNVYLDNNATTSIFPEALKAMSNMDLYANASSMHTQGRIAKSALDEARGEIKQLIGAKNGILIFTSGASESNNTLLYMWAKRAKEAKKALLVSAIEHPSIHECVKYFLNNGIKIKVCPVNKNGILDLDEYEKLLKKGDVIFTSVMYANNETGAIQPIKKICDLAHKHNSVFHTDATQALGKISFDVDSLGVDYVSFSAHKFYGPKGVGGLYVAPNCPIDTFIIGGHQENGLRAGTYNVPSIVASSVALKKCFTNLSEEAKKEWSLREYLREGIEKNIKDILINSPNNPNECLPNTLNVSFMHCEGESLLLYLDFEGIYVSTGSACATGSLEPSYVLLSQGVPLEAAHCSIRFSLGKDTTKEQIDYVIKKLPNIVDKIRRMSTRC